MSYYTCIHYVYFAIKFPGIFPVSGLLNPDGIQTRLAVKSPYIIYCFLTIVLQTMYLIIHGYSYCFRGSIKLRDTATLLGHISSHCFLIHFLKISTNWRKIMKDIENLERLLTPMKNTKKFTKYLNWAMVSLLVFGTVANVLHITYNVVMTRHCSPQMNSETFLDTYFKTYFKNHFDHVPISIAVGFLFQILEIQRRFIIYYVDFFIAAHALYLSKYFQSFNSIVRQRQIKYCGNKMQWANLQMQYTRLCRLVASVDDFLSPLIFNSLLVNLLQNCNLIYTILRQPVNIIESNNTTECIFIYKDGVLGYIYNYYALFLSIAKSSCTLAALAWLHKLSREPLKALYEVLPSGYNKEMLRFMDQVYHSKIGLTALKCFCITQGTILTFVSTIITYELIVIQLSYIAKY